MRRHASAFLWVPTVLIVMLGAWFLGNYAPDIPLSALRTKYTDSSSAFVTVDGMHVHYRDQGSGPTLMLLHGSASSLHAWDGWLEPLRYDFRVLRLDLPGFGLTGPSPEGDYRIERYVDFLRAFTEQLELDSFHLAGHELGGQIAWNFALQQPDEVQSLILVAATGFGEAPERATNVAGWAQLPGVMWLATHMTPRSLTEDRLLASFANPALVTETRVARHHELWRRPGNRRAALERAAAAGLERNGDPRALRQPTLILWGMEDALAPLTAARGFADDIPGARLITYPRVGHVPHEELPGPSARAALSFLRDRR